MQVRGQPGLHTEFKANLNYKVRPCLKNKKEIKRRKIHSPHNKHQGRRKRSFPQFGHYILSTCGFFMLYPSTDNISMKTFKKLSDTKRPRRICKQAGAWSLECKAFCVSPAGVLSLQQGRWDLTGSRVTARRHTHTPRTVCVPTSTWV